MAATNAITVERQPDGIFRLTWQDSIGRMTTELATIARLDQRIDRLLGGSRPAFGQPPSSGMEHAP